MPVVRLVWDQLDPVRFWAARQSETSQTFNAKEN